MIELPVVQPVVIEAVRCGVTCPGCGAAHQADYPPGFEPHRTFSPNLEVWVVYLREVHHLGYQRLERLLDELFGLSISQGALVNMLKRVALHVEPVDEGIRQLVRRSPVIGSDETRARVDGHNHWEWVFQLTTKPPSAAFANITTIVQTAHKNGLPIFQALRRLLIPSPLDCLDYT